MIEFLKVFAKDVFCAIFEKRPEDEIRENIKDIIHEVLDEREDSDFD